MEINKTSTRLGRPPKQEGRNTRERILDAAVELFAAQGFAGTSLRQITQEVGIKESAIYAHFASKEALYKAIFEQFGPPVAIIDELSSSDLTTISQLQPERVVREIAQRVIARWNEPRARLFLCLVLREGAVGANSEGALLHSTKMQVVHELAFIMQQWMEQGLVRNDFPAEQLAWELLTPLVIIRLSYWHAQATEAERELGHRRADLHIEYFLRTVLTQKTGQEEDAPGNPTFDHNV